MGLDRLKAKDSIAQVHNALEKVENRKNKILRNPFVYTDEKGNIFKTTERIVKSVEPPERRIPSDEELFPDGNGIPDYKLVWEHFRVQGRLTEEQLLRIIDKASGVFAVEPSMLKVSCPAVVVGDIHGQYHDMIKMLSLCPEFGKTQYLFLGDYVDRGDCSIEVLILLYCIKLNFPHSVWMIRGNHETRRMTEYFTFKKECEIKYSLRLYYAALRSFSNLPIAAILNDQFFCVHGGISKHLGLVQDVNMIDRHRPDPPSSGVFCDLEWSDPSPNYDVVKEKQAKEPLFAPNTERNCSYYYSFRAVQSFLRRNNLLSVVRGHQAQDAGYRMYQKDDKTGFPTVITIFSAPNYCHTYRNKAAALIYDGKTFNIKQFLPAADAPYYLPDFMNVFEWSVPFVCEKVIDILVCMLNVCTQKELEAEPPLSKEAVEGVERKTVRGSARAGIKAIKKVTDKRISTHKRTVSAVSSSLKTKLLAIGKTSRMLNILREESEQMADLRDAKNGRLPRGILMNGREELHRYIKSFSDAKKRDLKNEGLPPSDDEINEAKKAKSSVYRRYIEEGSSDVEADDVIL
ncbi:hypothetical protein BRETT_004706 [Brettanomyces bruxellensis]|uniref:Serine/threonine-protein phosphatase n=1 Tax=Dekkera bruxellensis TaxID=5007 RepID=A0A871R8G3_DEKBR|nr:uncharacterized protein BRETT_004706 [Brettanomyces bruxellensis]QOU20058.1 hypothetical protein BRETT_004706 [Brettanomyces bruxellensis]